MEKYLSTSFKRNDKKIKAKLKTVKESIEVTETLYVYFPKRFEDINITTIYDVVKTIGTFIVSDSSFNYALINIPTLLELEPSVIETTTIDDVEYTKLTLTKGNKLLVNTTILKDSSFIFKIFDEFCIKGKVPFYINADDLLKLFLTSEKYNGSKIGNNPLGLEAIVSIMTRDSEDVHKFIRHTNKDLSKLTYHDTQFVGLADVNAGIKTNIAKLTGAYLNDGITSVIVNPSANEADIEKYYRK